MIPDLASAVALDTWIIIGSFVAVSVLAVEFAGVATPDRVSAWFSASPRLQPVAGALLGLVPGCGGAIAVMPMYSRGVVGFGTVVATLAATAGDSAFVLLAVAPGAAPAAYGIAFVTALVAGLVVDEYGLGVRRIDRALGRSRPRSAADGGVTPADAATCRAVNRGDAATGLWSLTVLTVWWLTALVGFGIGLRALLTQSDAQLVLWNTDVAVGVAVVGLLLSGYVSLRGVAPTVPATVRHVVDPLWRSTTETSRIVLWVGAALVGYQLLVAADLDLGRLAMQAGVFAPIGAGLLGAVPGCGIHVGVVAAYGEGAVPFSALVANAISQDGDALFPLFAIDRRAALVATVYTTIPAVLVGVAVYFLWGLTGASQFGFGVVG